MRTGLIPITFALASAALAAACGGASEQDVRDAQTSGYRGDFAVIYGETLIAVRELYPSISEDARTGDIRTAWHPVHVQQSLDDDSSQGATVNPANQSQFNSQTTMHKQYFVRFQIHVVGGRPWRVRVHGEASSWVAGDQPQTLRGSEVPQWLEGRVESLQVAIHKRLKRFAVGLKYAPAAAEAPKAAPVDVAKYGAVPPGAAAVIAAVAQAAAAHDVRKLRTFMADQFTYSSGDEPSADTAIVVWQADPSILGELTRALDAGCAQAQATGEVVCPAAFASDSGQTGYRAGFRQAKGSWRMVSFTQGE
ncbi:MAG TPA: hypothetical protein VKB80_24975 [Kofleriaceae bacterium]|nr:hypothetical protein [Kofleriaceae bacterium]